MKNENIFPKAIISVVLVTFYHAYVLILLGEN